MVHIEGPLKGGKIMKEDSLKTLELEMAVLVRRITSITSTKKQVGLDRSAYLLLHQLSNKGTAGVKALACELQLDISTVSRQAASLEQKGYVEKAPFPGDRRAYFYQMTDLGTKTLLNYKQARLDKLSYLLYEWNDEECEDFGRLLKKFNLAIKERI